MGSFQVSTWFFTTFSVSGMKDKVRYLDNLQQLFTCIKPEQIDIPPFVLEYDARVSNKMSTGHTLHVTGKLSLSLSRYSMNYSMKPIPEIAMVLILDMHAANMTVTIHLYDIIQKKDTLP